MCHVRRIPIHLAASAAIVFASSPCPADKGRRTDGVCAAAADAVQSARASEQAGRVRAAVASYRICAAETACTALAPKCVARVRAMEEKLPSVVFLANDESGGALAEVQVTVDGQVVASKLDGRAMSIEPGLHDVAFVAPGGACASAKVMIADRQQDRVITVVLHPPPVAAPAPSVSIPAAAPRREADPLAVREVPAAAPAGMGHWAMPRSPWPYVLAGAGLASVAAGAVLAVWGNEDNSRLENECKPQCSLGSLQHVRNMYIAADVAYGTGGAGLVAATWWIAGSRSQEKPPAIGTAPVDVRLLPSGAFAAVSGSF
jgi:hypothetical protein